MTLLDFSMIMGLEFGGHLLKRLENIGDQLELVVELLGAHLNDYHAIAKQFVDILEGSNGYTDDQMTWGFTMYILGCSILCSKRDRIHLSFLGRTLMKSIDTIRWSGFSDSILAYW